MHIIKNSILFNNEAYVAGQEQALIDAVEKAKYTEKVGGTKFSFQYFLDKGIIDELPGTADEEREASRGARLSREADDDDDKQTSDADTQDEVRGHKPLGKMNVAELQALYEELTGEPADQGLKKKDLIEAIDELEKGDSTAE